MTSFLLPYKINLFCFLVIHSEEELHNEDGPCETPIPDVLDTSTCVYHVQFQPPLPTSQVELDPLRKTEHKEVIYQIVLLELQFFISLTFENLMDFALKFFLS